MARVRGIKKPHPLGSVASRSGVPQLTAESGFTAADGVKISELPAAEAANDTDQLEVNQGGTSRRVTVEQIAAVVAPGAAVNVKTFGACGDGATDDTVAIQAAIDFVRDAGGGVVNFPTGTYKVSASTLSEAYDNSGDVIPASGLSLVQRKGVSLIGQPDRSAKIYCPDTGISIVNQIAPENCTIEGFEIYSDWVSGALGVGTGIITLSTAGGADRKCRNNLYRNLYVHNVGGYGIGLESGMPTRCRIEDVDTYYTSADGLDLKARDDSTVVPVGNTVTNCTIRKHGVGTAGSAGIDVRAIWHLSGISVTEFGIGTQTNYLGIRFRTYPAPTEPDWQDCARHSTLTGFYIKPDPASAAPELWGIQVGSKQVHVSNGVATGCKYNYLLSGNVDGTPTDCVVANVTSVNATAYGVWVAPGASRTRIIGFTSMGSATAGIRNEAAETHVIGWQSISDAAAITTLAGVLATQMLVDGPTAGFQFNNTAANYMAGNLGIGAGKTTPAVALDVAGAASFGGNLDVTVNANAASTILHSNASAGASASTIFTQSVNDAMVERTVSRNTAWLLETGNTGTTKITKRYSDFDQLFLRTNAGVNMATLASTGMNISGSVNANGTLAIGAGANTQAFIKGSSTANLGLYYGTGDPTFSAAKGSLYTRTDATTTTTRLWVNTSGSTTWTNLTTAALRLTLPTTGAIDPLLPEDDGNFYILPLDASGRVTLPLPPAADVEPGWSIDLLAIPGSGTIGIRLLAASGDIINDGIAASDRLRSRTAGAALRLSRVLTGAHAWYVHHKIGNWN